MRAKNAVHNRVVLVVEDNELICALEVDVLRDLGYHAATAKDAEQALRMLGESRFASLITDIHLAGTLDGVALGRAAKVMQPDLKVMLVGADVDGLTAADLHGTADQVLTKPFTVDAFAERLWTLANCPFAADA